MRKPVICSFFLVCLTLATVCASAEVIHLKNGRTIWADHVRDTGTHIEYDLGDNTYSIPKSLVDRIDAGGSPPGYASSEGSAKPAHDLPEFAPADNFKNDPTLIGKTASHGCVRLTNWDAAALGRAVKKGTPVVFVGRTSKG